MIRVIVIVFNLPGTPEVATDRDTQWSNQRYLGWHRGIMSKYRTATYILMDVANPPRTSSSVKPRLS